MRFIFVFREYKCSNENLTICLSANTACGDCCFLPSLLIRWNLFWPGDFSRSLLERCSVSGLQFYFFFSPTTLAPFSLHLFNIFLPQLWLEALCSLCIWLSYFHECDIPQTHGGNFIILATNVPSDSRMNWLEFCGQKLKDGATSQTHYWIHNC